MRTTPWFEGWQKPVRPGVYQTRISAVGWSYWDGQKWSAQMYDRKEAIKHRSIPGATWKQWRGLVSPCSRKAPTVTVAVTPPADSSLSPGAVGGGTL